MTTTTTRLDESHGYRHSTDRPDIFSCTDEGNNMKITGGQRFRYCPWCGAELPTENDRGTDQ